MENISEMYLLKPDVSYKDDIISFRDEFIKNNDVMAGCSSLEKFISPVDWIEHLNKLSNNDKVYKGSMASEQYIYVRKSDNTIVGMVQLRRNLNKYYQTYYGNIGYSIRPSERRKGYAKRLLKEALTVCKKQGFKKLLLVCNVDNKGSEKVIIANGGVFESEVFFPDEQDYLKRFWIDL